MADTLGHTLADARRSQGKTIAEAEEATRIRAKLLEALEADDHESLPNQAYVRGYVISYAKFLNLDPKPLLDQYRRESRDLHEDNQLRDREPVVATRDQTHTVPWRITAIIIVLVVGAALAYWGIGRIFSNGDEDDIPPAPPVAEETSAPAPAVESTSPGVTDTETLDAEPEDAAQVENGQPFTLEVLVSDTAASWLKVTIDDLDAYEGTLAAGETKEWEVSREAVILVGKPEAVAILRDGEEISMPSGEVPEIRLSVTETQD